MYSCEEDAVTFEEPDTPCVAVADDRCTSCANAREIARQNPTQFARDPVQLLFNEHGSADKRMRLTEQLQRLCAIEVSQSQPTEPMRPIALPENTDDSVIRDRLLSRALSSAQRKVVEDELLSLQEILALTTSLNKELGNFSTQDDFLLAAKRSTQALLTEGCRMKVGLVHDLSQVPMQIGHFLSSLADADDAHFDATLLRLLSMSHVCLEGHLETLLNQVYKEPPAVLKELPPSFGFCLQSAGVSLLDYRQLGSCYGPQPTTVRAFRLLSSGGCEEEDLTEGEGSWCSRLASKVTSEPYQTLLQNGRLRVLKDTAGQFLLLLEE
jgi:hypothetical protein